MEVMLESMPSERLAVVRPKCCKLVWDWCGGAVLDTLEGDRWKVSLRNEMFASCSSYKCGS